MMIDLPNPSPEVKRISKIIGIPQALALIELYGGTRYYVPATPNAELVDLIGREAAEKLSQAWKGTYIKVPVARAWRVLVYRQQQMSYAVIARKVGCSENQVWRILNDHEMTSRQLCLFP